MRNTSTPHAEHDAIEVSGDSPDRIEIPMWVTAQIKLNPPQTRDGKPRRTIDGLYDVVLLLLGCRFGAHPDEVIRLNRTTIGRWAGVRADKATWITEYLTTIGFLEIYRGRHTADGREPDRFRVNVRHPAGYDGPQTLAELDLALSHPANPKMSVSAGQSQNPADGGKGQEPKPHQQGKGSVSAGQSQNPADGGLSRARRSDRSLLSSVEERRGEIEPAPGGTAEPPAAGQDEPRVDAYDLARRLPWTAWSERSGREVRRGEVRDVAGAMSQALEAGRVTLDEAEHVALHALSHANQPSYVVKAFTAGNVDRWLPAADVAPVEQQLPLPSRASAQSGAGQAEQDRSATPERVVLSEAERLPACDVEGGCAQPVGTPLTQRDIPDPNDDRGALRCACQGPIRERLKRAA